MKKTVTQKLRDENKELRKALAEAHDELNTYQYMSKGKTLVEDGYLGDLKLKEKEWHKGLQQIKSLKDDLIESNDVLRLQSITICDLVERFVTHRKLSKGTL